MRVVTAGAVAWSLVGMTPSAVVAQAERYELGARLERFEEAWEKHPDPAARQRAAVVLRPLTRQFLSLRFGESGRTFDAARYALSGTQPPAEQWADALAVVPERRLLDKCVRQLNVEVRAFYKVEGEVPAGASVTLRVGSARPVTARLDKLPRTLTVPVPEVAAANEVGEDFPLAFEVTAGGQQVRRGTVTVSVFRDVVPLLAFLRQEADDAEMRGRPTIETATLRDRAAFLDALRTGWAPEHDYPAADQYSEADHSTHEVREPDGYFNATRPGRLWLTVPTGKETRTACRLFVPKGLDEKKPVPLVVALHGAGGSENLFFEGYGNGRIVRECETRGWLLVAPRSPLGFLGGPPPVLALVDRLAERYPIDRTRVFVVGHSMGAAQAVELAQQHPGKVAAVAALGGSGRVRKAAPFAKLPVFVGVGSEDFALAGSRKLRDDLAAAGASDVTFKEYPGLEHLLVVPEALPDVFALFDRVAR